MPEASRVAIVDFGLGNLFSVEQACARVGLPAAITTSAREVAAADAVILPGVGAFGDAMTNLRRQDLLAPLRDVVATGRPLLGICLGMQLLMRESQEFGRHEGLGFIDGEVLRLSHGEGAGRVKVPHVGWNRVQPPSGREWTGTWLQSQPPGVWMYFVHSFYVVPVDASVVLATTTHGPTSFCAALQRGSLIGCQFHPERSGPQGLALYRRFADSIRKQPMEVSHG